MKIGLIVGILLIIAGIAMAYLPMPTFELNGMTAMLLTPLTGMICVIVGAIFVYINRK